MSTIELDSAGFEACLAVFRRAPRKLYRDPDKERAWLAVLIRTYLAEALRLRPMSEAPEYKNALWLTHGYAPLVASRVGNSVQVFGESEVLEKWEAEELLGWLPLPQPVEPQP